jgi:hypothetical protein
MAQLVELLKACQGTQPTSSPPVDSGKTVKAAELDVKSTPKDVQAVAANASTGQMFQSPVVVASPMPSYTGDTPVGPYLEQFKCKAKVNRWPKEEWGLQLLSALDGRARNLLAIEQFSENPTFEDVVEKLKANFGSDMSAVSHRYALDVMRRGPTEEIGALARRVKEVAMKAYPGLDAKYRDELTIAPFIRALQDDVLEPAIWAALQRPCRKPLKWLWHVRMD